MILFKAKISDAQSQGVIVKNKDIAGCLIKNLICIESRETVNV
jgi:hypothetical protein